jgi:FAD/FMN-containing dehydrogenase
MAPTATAFRRFAAEFSGEIVRRDDPGYDEARVVWNGMIDRYPELVVRPTNADEVAAGIRFGREEELPIAVRSGGHSIPGLSTCDDGIVIDLSRMTGVRVDADDRTAWVNGGALLGELDRAAQGVGLVCPVGVVSHTGVAGLTLGGGMGRLQRKYGLTIDNLLAVDVVTADGRHIQASEDAHADLFWGLRGAGANFGIATAFRFRLHPLAWPVTHGTLVHPIERATELAARFCELIETGPGELWASYGLARTPAGRPVATVTVLHSGRPEDAERDIADLRAFGPPLSDSIEPKAHLVPQTMADEEQHWGQRFSMKSAFVRSLDDAVVALLVEHVGRAPTGGDSGFSVWACGGAIARVPEGATAFTGRSAAYWLAAETLWLDPARDDEFRSWPRDAIAAVQPFATEGRYVNDVAETGADVARTIYGPAKYERLAALKRVWDPDNVFRLNQNIRPAPAKGQSGVERTSGGGGI